MVKGISKRIILIKSPDKRVFDEAIFIVKDDAVTSGITQADILHEAQEVACRYIKNHSGKSFFSRLPPPAFAMLGASATGLLWLLTSII